MPTITKYHAKPGRSEQVAALLASHWELLHNEGFATDQRAFLMRDPDEPDLFVEVFEWKEEEGPDKAWNHQEIAELWEQIQSLCENDITPEYYDMVPAIYMGGG
ncbi:MAG: hypothetical protein M3220_16165 [Chloroflexota bacterium]|nr:hypothetical protein [Chloroflexota bacterium]